MQVEGSDLVQATSSPLRRSTLHSFTRALPRAPPALCKVHQKTNSFSADKTEMGIARGIKIYSFTDVSRYNDRIYFDQEFLNILWLDHKHTLHLENVSKLSVGGWVSDSYRFWR